MEDVRDVTDGLRTDANGNVARLRELGRLGVAAYLVATVKSGSAQTLDAINARIVSVGVSVVVEFQAPIAVSYSVQVNDQIAEPLLYLASNLESRRVSVSAFTGALVPADLSVGTHTFALTVYRSLEVF